MSTDDPRDLLASYRDDRSPPAGAADRNWQRLAARIAAGEPAPRLVDEPVPRDTRSRNWALALAAAAAALIAARLLLPESGLFRRPDAASEAQHQRAAEDPQDATPRASAPARTTAPDPVPEVIPAPPEPPSPPARRPAPSTMTQEPSETDLARQLERVRAAARAAREGDVADALRRADDYLADHPQGAFLPEARLTRIEALCRLRRLADAARERDAFVAAYPDSPLRPRAESACREGGDDGSSEPRPSPP